MISAAPRIAPKRLLGSRSSNRRIKSLAFAMSSSSPSPPKEGNLNSLFNIFFKVASFVGPLNGVRPYKSSYKNTPNAHQSTALPCPAPVTISGERYSCVPTQSFENAVSGSATNSNSSFSKFALFSFFCCWFCLLSLLRCTFGETGAMKDKSKSDNMT